MNMGLSITHCSSIQGPDQCPLQRWPPMRTQAVDDPETVYLRLVPEDGLTWEYDSN